MKNKLATTEGALTKLDGFASVEEMKKWAVTVLDSGLLPHSITEPEQIITIVQHGKELGLTPHIALNNIHVISGRPTLSSAMLGSLLKRHGVEWVWDHDFDIIKNEKGDPEIASDGTANRRTTIHFYWKSKITDRVMDTTFSITWAQMILAGNTSKDNYLRLPKEMLRARTLGAGIRALFPEVLSGFYTEIEIQDVLPDEDIKLDVDKEGEIIIINNKETKNG